MALEKFTWQNGTQIEPAKVEIGGQSYNVSDAQYEGETPLSAANLNLMQDTLLGNVKDNLSDDTKIPSVKAVKGKLLWTNSNPTSNFVAQTITLSEALSNFDCYEILYSQAKLSSDPTNAGNRLMSTGKIPIGYGTVLNYAVNNRYRLIDRPSGNTSMTILDGYNGGQVDNDKCIPIYVIGHNTGLF